MSGIVWMKPRTLREKIQYTNNIGGIRDRCLLWDRIIGEKIALAYRRALIDAVIHGTGVIPIEKFYEE